jgi:hypothetical protein
VGVLLGESFGVFAIAKTAYCVEGIFDAFPVQDPVAAVNSSPGAESA